MDIQALLKQMQAGKGPGGAGGMPDFGAGGGDDSDDDDDEMPALSVLPVSSRFNDRD